MEEVKIHTEYIRLCDALKLSSAVGTGGHAKIVITDGLVSVNGEVCTQRGKKLRTGDVFVFENKQYKILSS